MRTRYYSPLVFLCVLLAILPGQVRAGGSVTFAEDVTQSLGGTEFAQALSHLEFHPVATGERIGNSYPGLSGARIGPYECRARVSGATTKPGVYPLRVRISTQPTFYNEEGAKVELGKTAFSKSEQAVEVNISLLPENEADTGDKTSAPVILWELLGSKEQMIADQECFFLNGSVLRLGQTEKDVAAILGKAKVQKGEPFFVEATGETWVTWEVPDLDIEVVFVLSEKDKSKTVLSLSAGAKSKVVTARGIQLGHPESRVKIAYADVLNKSESTDGETQIIGNMYFGLYVQIQDGKVESLYLGPGAE